MESSIGQIMTVIVLCTFFWGGGFLLQKAHNRDKTHDYSINIRISWIRLLGLRPGTDRIYLRYAFLQILAMLYLISGISVIWCCEKDIFNDLTGWLFIVLFAGAIFFGFLDVVLLRRRRKK